ncbi:MAG: low molecular weight phosphotyrosine protein phosphatase [Sulfuriferula sp.]|nr:low molecular weight phosphotyrosine protein phosphatase [Sulfuriferula sp.]
MSKHAILFVCMGNICRSPMAEGVFTHKARQSGLSLLIDSAGTHDYHVGAPPDLRAQQTMRQAGYDIAQLRGRQVCAADFAKYDYILAMDAANLHNLQDMAGEYVDKVQLYLNFSQQYAGMSVPDPYYGGDDGFKQVLAMVEDAADGLLVALQAKK